MQLKPQDFLVSLKLLFLQKREQRVTYAQLAATTGLAVSDTHSAVKRAMAARLLLDAAAAANNQFCSLPGIRANATTITEFALHGLKYVWPASDGPRRHGLATGVGFVCDTLGLINRGEMYVWPDASGGEQGIAVEPWHPAVPTAAAQDPDLYESLAMLEVLRTKLSRAATEAERVLKIRLLPSRKIPPVQPVATALLRSALDFLIRGIRRCWNCSPTRSLTTTFSVSCRRTH